MEYSLLILPAYQISWLRHVDALAAALVTALHLCSIIRFVIPANPTEVSLSKCFQAVFPVLNESGIVSATPESIDTWDSIANVRSWRSLLAVIEKEFTAAREPESNPSFEELLSYLGSALLWREWERFHRHSFPSAMQTLWRTRPVVRRLLTQQILHRPA